MFLLPKRGIQQDESVGRFSRSKTSPWHIPDRSRQIHWQSQPQPVWVTDWAFDLHRGHQCGSWFSGPDPILVVLFLLLPATPLRSLMQQEARLNPFRETSPKCFAFLLCTGGRMSCDFSRPCPLLLPLWKFSGLMETPRIYPHVSHPSASMAAKNNKRAQHELKIRFLSHFVLLRLCVCVWRSCKCVSVCLRAVVLVLVTSSGWLCASLADVFMKSCD